MQHSPPLRQHPPRRPLSLHSRGATLECRDGERDVGGGVLMASYNSEKAWWPSSWWNSAVALQTIEHYMLHTGDRSYLSQVDNTFEVDNAAFPNARDWHTQASALSALIAVVPARHGR